MFKELFFAGISACALALGNIAPVLLNSAIKNNLSSVERFDSALIEQYQSMNKGSQRNEFNHLIKSGEAEQIAKAYCDRKQSNQLTLQDTPRFLNNLPKAKIQELQIKQANVEIIQTLASRHLCNQI